MASGARFVRVGNIVCRLNKPRLDRFSGRKYGIRANPEEEALERVNQEFGGDPDYSDIEDLDQKLRAYKAKFLEFEKDANGNIDLMGLKKMLQDFGQAVTHLELKNMIKQVDKTNSGTICYRDFLTMMLGPRQSVLKLIMRFEGKAPANRLPAGVAPRRDLSSLP